MTSPTNIALASKHSATPVMQPHWRIVLDKVMQWKIIPPLDKYPWAIQFAQSLFGKAIMLAAFALGLYLHSKTAWLEMTALLAIMTYWPQYRAKWLIAATLYWLYANTWFNWELIRTVSANNGVTEILDWGVMRQNLIAAVLLFCCVFYALAYVGRNHWLMRRPIIVLHLVNTGLMLIACYAPLTPLQRTYLWAFLIILVRYVWFLGYTLLDMRAKNSSGFAFQIGHYIPFWMGLASTPTPMPKGAAYLRKIEAKNPTEQAICQLKALKLIYWAVVLMVVQTVFANIVYGSRGILEWQLVSFFQLPSYRDAIHQAVVGHAYPWYIGWLSLVCGLFNNVLYLAIWGHAIIAACRMAGYNALRGTYKPLLATTIAEFWNRYFYYFKELLVEFFFYPTYLRYFKTMPRFRLFFATLVAAGFGNVLFHFIRDISFIIEMGFWQALVAFHVYMFYGLLLGTAIGISQLRDRQARHNYGWFRKHVVARVVVIGFYCLVLIFDSPDRTLSLADYFRFVFSLVNISQ